jgi:hypothetical protein
MTMSDIDLDEFKFAVMSTLDGGIFALCRAPAYAEVFKSKLNHICGPNSFEVRELRHLEEEYAGNMEPTAV